jgi:hypothetical protein
MGWVLRLVETEGDGPARWIDVIEISRFRDVDDIANLGLSLAEGKLLLARVQQAVAAAQAKSHMAMRPDCSACGGGCHINNRRGRRVARVFAAPAIEPTTGATSMTVTVD